MNPTNRGSFGAAAGGMTPALEQVMSQVKSGQYVPVTSQVTGGAPNAGSSPQPSSPMTGGMPAPQSMTPGGQPMGSPALPFDSSEAKIIISSLATRLKALSKLQGV